ncbi:YjzD family protein [Tetragenococcus solitarius]|uniref:YjzD family protein n=1 Tax=Tetragenococcus solitarius TaxID=71453 RepID=A0ABN3Y6F6_9ENTE|nr:YjzD family protein [Tetragenococcus solitarius]
MRYLITIIWSLILGQVVGFLGSSLTSTNYDFILTTICSLVVGFIVIAIGSIVYPSKKQAH